MKHARKALYLLPLLFCLWLYWEGLFAWFQGDDFAFLGLNHDIRGWGSFWKVIFTASPQGTLRPWSERAYFILFWRLFGLDALPYHVWVFLTQFVNLLLLVWIVLKVTGSRVAAILAPILWTANASLAIGMSWSSGYNEILCATFLLGAFALLLKFEESGEMRYYYAQAAVFILGFGALELNIVYPAIAATWGLVRKRRRHLLLTLPLFGVSAIYYAIHRAVAPPQLAGPYSMHFDSALPQTLWTYWRWTFVAPYWQSVFGYNPAPVVTILTAAILIFLAWEARAGRYVPLFFAAWFVITLAPLLPLRDHVSHYYLSVPSLGVAAVFAMGASRWKIPGAAAIAIYLAVEIPAARASTRFEYERTQHARDLVLGVKRATELHPGKMILLTDISEELYGNVIFDRPFRTFSDTPVYLAPGTLPGSPGASQFVLPPGPTLHALAGHQFVVYSASEPVLRNITLKYQATAPTSLSPEAPRMIDAGAEVNAYLLGEGWFPREGAYRWMGHHASLTIGGPRIAGEKLHLTGYCRGPISLSISAGGTPLLPLTLSKAETPFQREFALPVATVGGPSITLTLDVSSPDSKTVAFGRFDIH